MIRNKPSRRDKGAAVAPRRNVIDMEQVEREIQNGVPGDVFNILLRKRVVNGSQRKSFLKRWGKRRISLGKERYGFPVSFVRRKESWRLEPTSELRQGPELLSRCYGVNEEISALRRVYLSKSIDFYLEDIARIVRRAIADAVWDILVAYAGAIESGRNRFKESFQWGPSYTFRDDQNLFWKFDDDWRVSCVNGKGGWEFPSRVNAQLARLRPDIKNHLEITFFSVKNSL